MKTCCAVVVLASSVWATNLDPRTEQQFQAYIQKQEAAWQSGASRWPDLKAGSPSISPWNKEATVNVHDGLIHDWVAAQFVPGVTADRALATLLEVEKYPSIYQPDVVAAKVLSRNGDQSHTSMRFVKKKVITVVLDAEFDVTTMRPSGQVRLLRSRSTRISEVEDPGESDEKVLPPGTGYGFSWNLNSYWRLESRDGGVYVECRSITLTRDVPTGLGWAIKPMITSLPREALEKTLRDTIRAAGH